MDIDRTMITIAIIGGGFFLLVGATLFYKITEPEFNIHIDRGIYGTVLLKTGNCAPDRCSGLDCVFEEDSCKELPISRTVYARDPKKNMTLVLSARSNRDGFYEMKLPPGRYSILVEDAEEEVCHTIQDSIQCPVEVKEGLTRYDPIVDNAIY